MFSLLAWFLGPVSEKEYESFKLLTLVTIDSFREDLKKSNLTKNEFRIIYGKSSAFMLKTYKKLHKMQKRGFQNPSDSKGFICILARIDILKEEIENKAMQLFQ